MLQNRLVNNKIDYTVACVSNFAFAHNISKNEAFSYLYKHKAIDFLKEHYDVEHTLSLDDAVEDMTEISRQNGGTL